MAAESESSLLVDVRLVDFEVLEDGKNAFASPVSTLKSSPPSPELASLPAEDLSTNSNGPKPAEVMPDDDREDLFAGVHECWSVFKNHLVKVQEQVIPFCQKSSKQGRRPAWLNRELLMELQKKNKLYDLWKRGQTSQEDYIAVVCMCREKTQKAKAQLELKLASVVSDNKKGFSKYVNSKRRSKENIGPILVEDGHLTNMDEEKVEAFNAFFASVFNNMDRPWAAWSPESEDHEYGNSGFPFVDTEIVRDQLYQLNVHKPMEPDGIHPRVLKELVDVMAGPLSIIYQRSGEVTADWKLANAIPIYKKYVMITSMVMSLSWYLYGALLSCLYLGRHLFELTNNRTQSMGKTGGGILSPALSPPLFPSG
ncbi:mitochondrial enolase superfamily member 1 [Grus japonensis]|uniref:Mitochondrial enolase superfamily member 1 n=1 Tax=Grus japonensis TaxID=30415 RepID=A0ABC9YBA4_GRUJA